MVVLLGIDYRVSDFGRYHEIALAICVTPKEAAAQPGVAVRPAVGQRPVLGRADAARLGLSQGFLRRPACLLRRQLRAVLHRARGRREFFLTVPRFGTSVHSSFRWSSTPFRKPDADDAIAGSVRTIMERSGAGEGVQVGGNMVELHLGHRPTRDAERQSGSAIASAATRPSPVCATSCGTWGSTRRLPAVNGWTERMTGEFGAPGPLGLHPFGNH